MKNFLPPLDPFSNLVKFSGGQITKLQILKEKKCPLPKHLELSPNACDFR